MTIAASGALVGANFLINRYADRIATENLLGEAGKQRKDNVGRVALDGPLNILLLGSDFRKKHGGKGWRADTIMMLHVPRSHDRGYLLSFSRDMLVDIPAAKNFQGGEDKLNAAFVYGGNGAGGYRLLAKTLSNLMGVRFDSGAVINFQGFIKVVRALGGVRMCVETPPGTDQFTSIHKPHRTFKKGCQKLTGREALDYLRQRKQFPDGDYARMEHQQQFLRALVQRARDQNVHRNLGKLDELVTAGGESLIIDRSLPVVDLAFTLRNIGPEDLTAITVPVQGRMAEAWYADLVPPAPSLFESIREETVSQWVIDHPKHVNSLT
ncbi:MAG: LCP family protein [Micromonosporaceae bacterium]